MLKKKKVALREIEVLSFFFHTFSLIDDIIGCLELFIFFTFLHSSQKYFYSSPLSLSLCSLSLSASRFLHRFSRQGRPRCLLNWKPALAAAASPSQRNTEIHSFIITLYCKGLHRGWSQLTSGGGTPWASH